jgi:mannose-1-phosphate guanylyltransferase
LATQEAVAGLRATGSLWGLVLAGGEGVRLRALAHRLCGEERPKQYVAIFGDRTLLRQTLDRVALAIPASHTVVVTLRDHAPYFAGQWAGPEPPHLLVQPADRGTAPGILFPVHWISRRDPGATVVVFPSDHFISDEERFMAHITRIAAWVEEHADRLVLLGARATSPEVEYGWLELGRPLDASSDRPVWEVRRFWEKPSEERARTCLEAGCLWNTFILVGKAATFRRAGRAAVPEVEERLARAEPFLRADEEAWALHQAYALMPRANFSRSVLEPCPPFLAVAALPRLAWSDLGSPRRVFDVLGRVQNLPPWVLASDLPTPVGARQDRAAEPSGP